MGRSTAVCDDSLWSANMDGSKIQNLINRQSAYSKQIAVIDSRHQILSCDLVGTIVDRCDYESSNHEVVLQRIVISDHVVRTNEALECWNRY